MLWRQARIGIWRNVWNDASDLAAHANANIRDTIGQTRLFRFTDGAFTDGVRARGQALG